MKPRASTAAGPARALFALLAAGALIAAMASAPVSAAAPRNIALGFAEPLFGAPAPAGQQWLKRGRRAGGSIARLNVSWAATAPARRPRGFDPADHTDRAYDWTGLDTVVRRSVRHGYRVMLTVYDAPRWAEGKRRPSSAEPGTWKPRPRALRAFAKAIATRYDGRRADPARPGRLPRVRFFQAWNEQNLNSYLAPQWRGRQPVSAVHYRAMLNAFYAGVNAAQPAARVLSGGTAPYGDFPGGDRVPPVTFWRRLLCLSGAKLRPLRCPNPVHLDILAHHPINAGSPTTSARNPKDATTPDFGPLRAALGRAIRTGRALPRRGKAMWATEIWWDSAPPDPRGVPLRRHARWYQQALYVLWRQRVRAVIFLQVGDSPPLGNFSTSLQSGVYFASGKPKPARRAVRFPLVVARRRSGGLTAWGIAPHAGRVRIQRRRGDRWVTVATRRAKARGTFTARLRPRKRGRYRARLDREKSLVWSLR